MQAVKARLIVVTSTSKHIERVEKTPYKVGSSQGMDVDCLIKHETVSKEHAKIFFRDGQFWVQDLRSKNGILVNGVQIPPGTDFPLEPDSHLRFGTVETLFVVDKDQEAHAIPFEAYARALDNLVALRLISKKKRRSAEAEARGKSCSPGELLVYEGAIGAGSWSDAFRRPPLPPPSPWLPLAVAVIGLTGVGVLVWLLIR